MHRRTIILLLSLVISSRSLFAQKTQDVLVYIASYKDLAMREMKRTGIPAAIVLAQGIHETEAGTSDLVRKSNNHFGIKCKATWTGDKVFHDDDSRGECFRSYAKPEDSYVDHSDFLKNSPRYAFLFNLDPTDYEGWAYGLKKAGYATNIRYSQILIKIIHDYNLEDYTLIAMGKMKESEHLLAVTGPNLPPPVATETLVKEAPNPETIVEPLYPTGAFTINETKVIYAKANTAWLSIAQQYKIPLSRLWDFNDLEKDDDILLKGQLVYLQRKRKTGSNEYHLIQNGETLYDVCQSEGIRLESLLEMNQLNGDMQPANGEKLFLRHTVSARPALASEQKDTHPQSDAPTSSYALQVSEKQNTQATLNIPASSGSNLRSKPDVMQHVVTTKETLFSISRKYGITQEKLREWNRLDSMNLKVGQALIIYKND